MINHRLIIRIAAVVLGGAMTAPANYLANPGFELNPQGPTNAIISWTSYSPAAGRTTSQTGATAHTGTNYFKVFQAFNGAVNYNGIYQDYVSGPGAEYVASGWAYNNSGDALAGQNTAWLEVTFRNATGDILALYRSGPVTTNLIASGAFLQNTWTLLPVTNRHNPTTFQFLNTVTNLVAPTNTSYARFQIVFQGDQLNSGGSMYFDDLALTQTAGSPYGNWNLIWSDEFNSTNINTNIWKFETGNGASGWGNNELQYYTSRRTNAFVDGNLLHIVARKENFSGFAYTSARMKSQGLFNQRYGRFEFRAKNPQGKGYWPALWMMPETSAYGGWAASGEIDIMENKGGDPKTIIGTLHFGGSSPANVKSSGPDYKFPPGDSATNFHVYLIEWTTNAFNWFVDGQLYQTQTDWYSTGGTYPAPFNQPFYFIMNLAIGGNFDGNPTTNTVFPGELLVDYVRVYAQVPPLQLSLEKSNAALLLTWPTNVTSRLQQNTNLTGAHLTTGWVNVAGATSPRVVPPTNTRTFFRLISP